MKRTGITRKVTPRLAASRTQYRDMQTLVLDRDGHACVRCGVPAEATHHRKPRGMGGASRQAAAHDASHLISLCSVCHVWVESERAAARLMGWLVPVGVDPAGYQLLWHGQWCHLTDRGTVLGGAAARRLRV